MVNGKKGLGIGGGIILLFIAGYYLTGGQTITYFYDDFTDYSNNTNISGQGGWLTENCEPPNYCNITTRDGKNQLQIISSGATFAHVYRQFNSTNHTSFLANVYLPNPLSWYYFSIWNGSFSTAGDQGEVGEGYRNYLSTSLQRIYMPDVPGGLGSLVVSTNTTTAYTADRYYLWNLTWNGDLLTLDINGTRILNYTNTSYTNQTYIGFGTIGTMYVDWVNVTEISTTQNNSLNTTFGLGIYSILFNATTFVQKNVSATNQTENISLFVVNATGTGYSNITCNQSPAISGFVVKCATSYNTSLATTCNNSVLFNLSTRNWSNVWCWADLYFPRNRSANITINISGI